MIITNGPGEGLHVEASSEAIDYAPQSGTSIEVRATAAGVVLPVVYKSDFGWVVRIKHSNGLISFYSHLDGNEIYVTKDDSVSQGYVIAKSGNSGNGAGYHLHFEVRCNFAKIFFKN